MKLKNLVSLVLAVTLSFSPFSGYMTEVSAANAIEQADGDRANSWRYVNGEKIQKKARAGHYQTWPDVYLGGKKGIDVSHHNGEIDWAKVKEAGVDYAIIRCGYGSNQEKWDDKSWKANADACTELGIPFGVYLYSYADSMDDAVSEAEHVLRLIEGYDLAYPVYYDLEDKCVENSFSKAGLAELAKTFCDMIEDAGYEAGIYANKYWFSELLTDPIFDTWDRWVAQYNDTCTYEGNYVMWQCSDEGLVDGISTVVDLNVEFDWTNTIVLYTNDVHCAIDDYSELAAYAAQLEKEGNEVWIVDAGDAIQGEIIGSQTSGSAVIDLMNTVGYDFAVPGNHEFDYGMDTFLNLANNESEFTYLSANFIDLRTNESVFAPYEIVESDGEKIAFIGVSTPETYTKSTPSYFQDKEGNPIYGFAQTDLYEVVQEAIDAAKEEGADKIIAIGHLGMEGITEGWTSEDVIANTTGIDVWIDGHSHETIEGNYYVDKAEEEVLLSSTGEKFTNFGKLIFWGEDQKKTELISLESVDENSSEEAKAAYDIVQKKIDEYNAEIAYLYDAIGTSEVELTINDPDTGIRAVRTKETNMGDFVADAYRSITGADVAFVNGGCVRSSIMAGEVSRKSLMDVNPWNNKMCVISVSGQKILDALEFGSCASPNESGGFLQTSGLTYEIHNYLETPIILDEYGVIKEIDSSKEPRVKNVKINGEAIDPEKMYTLAGNYYMLKEGGDGYTMFMDSEVLQMENLPTDADMLIQYFTETLGGKITKEQYGNPKGEGRIIIYQGMEGDVNGDGIVDTSDAQAIFNHFMGIEELPDTLLAFADIDGDNYIDTSDAQAAFNIFMGLN